MQIGGLVLVAPIVLMRNDGIQHLILDHLGLQRNSRIYQDCGEFLSVTITKYIVFNNC